MYAWPRRSFPLLKVAAQVLTAAALFASSAQPQIRDPLEVQKGRDAKLLKRGSIAYYSEHWSLDDLPEYKPQQSVSGVIRQWGSNYFQHSGLGKAWEDGFKKH